MKSENLFQDTEGLDPLLKNILDTGINLTKTTESLNQKIEEFLIKKNPKIPTVVSIGKQSLGKSSLLNKIFDCDFPQKKGFLNIQNTVAFSEKYIPVSESSPQDFDLLDMEGIDSDQSDNVRDIININFAFLISNVIILHVEEKDITNRHFRDNLSYIIWQALRNLKKNEIKNIPYIVLFLRDPESKIASQETLNKCKNSINSFIEVINQSIQSSKERLLKSIENIFQIQERGHEMQAFEEMEKIAEFKIAKYYLIFYEPDLDNGTERYLKVQEPKFELFNFEEVKLEISTLINQNFQVIHENPFYELNPTKNEAHPKIREELQNMIHEEITLTSKYLYHQYKSLYQDTVFNFYSYFNDSREYLDLFQVFTNYDERIKTLEKKGFFTRIKTRVRTELNYIQLNEDEIKKLRLEYTKNLNKIYSDLQIHNEEKKKRFILYLIYNYSNQLEFKIKLDPQNPDSQVYQTIETIIKFNKPDHNKFQISKLAQIIDQYKSLPYYNTIENLIKDRISRNFTIKLVILKFFKEKYEILMNEKYQFKKEVDDEIDYLYSQNYYIALKEVFDLLEPFVSIDRSEVIKFTETLRHFFVSELMNKFKGLSVDHMDCIVQEINGQEYSFTLLERLFPQFQVASYDILSFLVNREEINSKKLQFGLSIFGAAYRIFQTINNKTKEVTMEKIIKSLPDHFIYGFRVTTQTQNVSVKKFKLVKELVESNVFKYKSSVVHNLNSDKSSIINTKITLYCAHNKMRSQDFGIFRKLQVYLFNN